MSESSKDCERLPGEKTILKLHVSVPSQLQAHASLSIDGTLTAESGIICTPCSLKNIQDILRHRCIEPSEPRRLALSMDNFRVEERKMSDFRDSSSRINFADSPAEPRSLPRLSSFSPARCSESPGGMWRYLPVAPCARRGDSAGSNWARKGKIRLSSLCAES